MLKTKRHSRGVALIEVLVSVLLLAVGILGVIGLQSTLVQASTDNRMRATATLLAGEVASSLWVGTTTTDFSSFSGALPATHPSAARITSTLPLGTATVTGASGGGPTVGGTVTIAVSWKMPNEIRRTVTQSVIITAGNPEYAP
jgi:type IV pilus assembly protein PilV